MSQQRAQIETEEPVHQKAIDPSNWIRGGRTSWLVSLTIHLASFAVIGLSGQREPRGAAIESAREAGIVLVARSDERSEYFTNSTNETAAFTTDVDLAAVSAPDITAQPAIAGLHLPIDERSTQGAAPLSSGMLNADELALSRDQMPPAASRASNS